ncbi:MAG: chemotaxis protein CheD [Nitrospirae bacterium]|nr:MAG: chemotaxis protein CheD [Nitrospirota bacterium]
MTPIHTPDALKVYLQPGELYVGEEPTKVVTVLGSCVSVTLFCKRLQIGAICHGVLPHCRKVKKCHELCRDSFKYVDCSLHYMIGRMRSSGCMDSELEVKLFGGADTLPSQKENTIGSMNVKMALEMIRQEHLRIIAADVGDSFGRKIIFLTHTGDVYLKRLKDAAALVQKPGVTFKTRGK